MSHCCKLGLNSNFFEVDPLKVNDAIDELGELLGVNLPWVAPSSFNISDMFEFVKCTSLIVKGNRNGVSEYSLHKTISLLH